MNQWRHRRAFLAFALLAAMFAPLALSGWAVRAQDATPASGSPNATPVPGAQTWQVLVNNVSPEGENWSFNAFYPDRLRAHPGDTIVFTLAPNDQAFHTVMVLVQALTPMEMYQGFAGGFVQPNPNQPDQLQSAYFGNEPVPPSPPCGSAGQLPCLIAQPVSIEFGTSSPVLVNPPSDSDQGNTSFVVTLDPALPLGPYYVMSVADGPTMSGRIDVVAPDQPVQPAAELQAAAERQYEADLSALAGHDRVSNPPEASNPDGTKTWQVDAGSSPDNARLSVNEFSHEQMVIHAGDTVTWTNRSPAAVAHTVSGFFAVPGALPEDLNPYQPVCVGTDGQVQLPPAGTFPPDFWKSCPSAEANYLTAASQPSAPSGAPYSDGSRTSGILLNQEYLDSPIGDGLPFASSYSVTFPEVGTYHYLCAIHPGMGGTVIVTPQPRVG